MYRFSLAAAGAAMFFGTGAAQAVTITADSTSYSQNFNTLASSGTGSVLPEGWSFVESGSNANATYAAGTGSSNTGNTYSFGTTSGDRALGTLLSTNLLPVIYASFTNGTGKTISDIALSYVGEMWRLGTAGRSVADRLDFSYSIDGGAEIAVDALDFFTPDLSGAVGARNGNSDDYRTLVEATLAGINLDDGSTIRFSWTDFNIAPGADDGLAIDDFNLAATLATDPVPTVPEPATWAMMLVGFGLAGGALRGRRGKAALAA